MSRRIGPYDLKNPWVLAPMAGVSEQPFRVMAFRQGAALCPTELVSAQGLWRANSRTMRYLRHDKEVERPYSLQLFGGEPEAMAKAAMTAKEFGAQIIDINMGCPVKKVTKSGSGSALLCDPERAALIVRLIREATGLPVTAKIRSGWDHQNRNFLQMADALGAAGVAALAVHPRTRAQAYSGKADWTVIADLKRHVGEKFPIIGNGDVKTPADALRMIETTGCDFVMIGRGALGNPWIFRQLEGGAAPTPKERCATVLQHFAEHLKFAGEARNVPPEAPQVKRELPAVSQFRKHLAWYAHGLYGASAFRNEVNKLESSRDVIESVERFFLGANVDVAAPTDDYDVDYRQALG
jgi:nifR3 family TIM-barrel protein